MIANNFEFLSSLLKWEHGYSGVRAGLAAIEKVPAQQSVDLLQVFIEEQSKALNGQSLELCEIAGKALGTVMGDLQKQRHENGNDEGN